MKTNKNNIFLISKYRQDKDLPLWVGHMEKGQQPERLFHSHNFMEIVLIRGRGTHLLEDLAEPVSEGDLLIIPPGFVHAYADCSELEAEQKEEYGGKTDDQSNCFHPATLTS